jgi:hypothetical protein
MIRLFVPLLNMLVILTLQMFPGNVSVKMDVPAQVNAGSEFEVRITLNKGDLDGFSRFQQNIPAGLSAISDQSSNADFTFTDKHVRLIWLRVPKNDEITVSYKVKVDERLKGNFTLGGKFSYIDNNERKFVDVSAVSVTILPSSKVDPSMIVDVNDYEKMFAPVSVPTSAENNNIAVIRQRPYPGNAGEYIVNLLVNKEATRNFAKIEEDVPAGYIAVALDPKDAIFTFKSQKVKFLWMNLPLDPYFMVSYRLIPRNKAKLAPPSVQGAFSYLVDDRTISVPVNERDVQLASLSANDIQELVAQIRTEPVQEPASQLALVTGNEITSLTDNTVKDAAKTEDKSSRRKVRRTKNETSELSLLLEQEQGVYYRIQLAAGHNQVNINRYFKRMKIEKEVRIEKLNGWQKYSVGSFPVYREARDYRIHIWNTTPVKDAFVTAYNNGQRVTGPPAAIGYDSKGPGR